MMRKTAVRRRGAVRWKAALDPTLDGNLEPAVNDLVRLFADSGGNEYPSTDDRWSRVFSELHTALASLPGPDDLPEGDEKSVSLVSVEPPYDVQYPRDHADLVFAAKDAGQYAVFTVRFTPEALGDDPREAFRVLDNDLVNVEAVRRAFAESGFAYIIAGRNVDVDKALEKWESERREHNTRKYERACKTTGMVYLTADQDYTQVDDVDIDEDYRIRYAADRREDGKQKAALWIPAGVLGVAKPVQFVADLSGLDVNAVLPPGDYNADLRHYAVHLDKAGFTRLVTWFAVHGVRFDTETVLVDDILSPEDRKDNEFVWTPYFGPIRPESNHDTDEDDTEDDE